MQAGGIAAMGRMLTILAALLGTCSLVLAAIVLIGVAGDNRGNFGLPEGAAFSNVPAFLACALIANVVLLGVLVLRKTRTLDLRTRQRNVADNALDQSEARLRLAQTAGGIATTDWDIAADRAVLSANFSEVFGVQPELSPGKSPYEVFIGLVHPEDRIRVDALHLRLLQSAGIFSDEFRVSLGNDDIRWIAMRGEVFRDTKNIPRRLTASYFDITERRRNEEKLKQSLDILEFANEAGEIGVWDNDFMAKKATIDHRARNILGLPPQEAGFTFRKFVLLLHPGDQQMVQSAFIEARRSGARFAVECRLIRPDGGTKWARISGKAEIDPRTGRAMRMAGIVFDITDRRERERHLRFLMREITHRSKNLLAVIQAMARQTKNTSRSLDEFQSLFAARLQGLSASHDLLVTEDWHGAWLDDIIRSQVAHLIDPAGGRMSLRGPRLQVKPEAAHNIGMAVHELATNAAKYGALSNESGKISVFWRMIAAQSGGERLVLDWQELNGPAFSPPDRRGFGSVVTERIVPRALDGQVRLSFEPGGVRWSLDIPASFILGPGGT